MEFLGGWYRRLSRSPYARLQRRNLVLRRRGDPTLARASPTAIGPTAAVRRQGESRPPGAPALDPANPGATGPTVAVCLRDGISPAPTPKENPIDEARAGTPHETRHGPMWELDQDAPARLARAEGSAPDPARIGYVAATADTAAA
jgi:hypothetical protein